MTSHFKFYPGSEEVVIPWNARYSFPSQANKAIKTTPRIPPKNGETFTPGQTIRFEFPAQGYVNTANTTLVFDADIKHTAGATPDAGSICSWFQNNIQSVFNRGRILYGANPIEDILQYNQIVRNLTEWTTSNNNNYDQFSVNEGIGRIVLRQSTVDVASSVANFAMPQHARIMEIHSLSGQDAAARAVPSETSSQNTARRRYQVQLLFGLLTQGKLLPTKFMASQLAIELTLESAAACMMSRPVWLVPTIAAGTTPVNAAVGSVDYSLTNLVLVPEILEFDAAYDALFLKGLQDGGVPIKFNKWHTYSYTITGGNFLNIMIPERSRSVKALFSVIRKSQADLAVDNGATYAGTTISNSVASYQYRIGGRYFPASPCIVNSPELPTGYTSGGVEAFMELQKALNMVGDYRLSCAPNSSSWNAQFVSTGESIFSDGLAITQINTNGKTAASTKGYATGAAPPYTNYFLPANDTTGTFCMAICLETTNGAEISGLNAEEQSDISLMVNFNGNAASSGYQLDTYVLYDALLVLKPNNVMELIE